MLKRSQINHSIAIAQMVFDRLGMRLPPFAAWQPDDWTGKGDEYTEIKNCMLGWDVTDFGMEDFTTYGRCLFTLRNGRYNDLRYPKTYAEKFILDPEGQRAPAHFHRRKREDIINRGTGFIILELSRSSPDGQIDPSPFQVSVDGISRTVPSGYRLTLKPGESIHLEPGIIHSFWGEGGNGIVVDGIMYGASGEVSSVCDDENDNVFINGAIRFPEIEEDETAEYCLCHEYHRYF